MEWIKIKAEHNSDELSDAQFGSLVRYQLLIARIGRTPTDKEIRRQTSIKTLRSAEEVLRSIGSTLEHIESKVIEDREQIQRNREVSKKTSSKYRDKKKSDTSPKRHAGITDKIREEENREDKEIITKVNKKKYGEHNNVLLSEDEYLKLQTLHGIDKTELIINKLSNFKLSNGKKYKSDYGAINTWVIKAVNEEKKGVINDGLSRSDQERLQRAEKLGLLNS